MNIWEFYQFVNFCLNKFQSGSYGPDEFNIALGATYLDLLKIKLGLPEDFQFSQKGFVGSVARQEWQNSQIITDDIANLLPTISLSKNSSGYFDRPDNYVRFSMAGYNVVVNQDTSFATCGNAVPEVLEPVVEYQPIEPVTDATWNFRRNNAIIGPDAENPIMRFGELGMQVLPKSVSTIELTYVRLPKKPVLGFTIDPITAEVTYVPSTSTQLDFMPILHNDYAAIVLKYIGINLSNEQVIGFANERQKGGQ